MLVLIYCVWLLCWFVLVSCYVYCLLVDCVDYWLLGCLVR